jgi:hypothetical protein
MLRIMRQHKKQLFEGGYKRVGDCHYLYSMAFAYSRARTRRYRSKYPYKIAMLKLLVHNLYSHVTLLGWAVSTGRARKFECSAERQLAARAANVSSLGVVGNNPVKCQ